MADNTGRGGSSTASLKAMKCQQVFGVMKARHVQHAPQGTIRHGCWLL